MMEAMGRTPDIIVAEIHFFQEQAKTTLLQAAVEIGRRLHEAKSLLPHGTWGSWLKTNFEYSERSAQNMMNIAREYAANPQALADLSYTGAVALLGLPEKAREEFLETHDTQEMSTREIEDAVRDIKKELDATKTERDGLQVDMERLLGERDNLETEIDARAREAEAARREATALQEQLKSAKAIDTKAIQKKLDHAEQEAQRLEAELKAERERPIEVAVKIPDEVEKELQQLRDKAKKLPSEAVATFRARFAALNEAFGATLDALRAVRKEDDARGVQYTDAMSKLLAQMNEALEE